MSYGTVSDHLYMTHDHRRNHAYGRALRAAITPQTTVLDLGAGLGIHGLMAAQLGARHVYMVEPQDVLQVARQTALAEQIENRITFLQSPIEHITLPDRVDVIVSVFTGNFLLTEDLLPILFHARDRWLAPGGKLIPHRAQMQAVPICAPDLHDRYIGVWNRPSQGLDFNQARSYAANAIYYVHEELQSSRYLAQPLTLREMDFYTEQVAGCDTAVTFPVLEDGLCHGIAGWFQIQVGSEWLSTAPHDLRMHWRCAFLPVDPPLPVRTGQELTLRLVRPPFGEWTWSLELESEQRLQSTFWQRPLALEALQKSSPSHQPVRGQQGNLVLSILQQMDGNTSTELITHYAMENFPDYFLSIAEARQFVQNLVKRYG